MALATHTSSPATGVDLSRYPDAVTANEESGCPPPVGAFCSRCLSNELVQSRKTSILARLMGYKLYRCRQCMSRTLW